MAGVTDAPFRKIAREFGAGLACTEMISSEALVRRHHESFRLMALHWDQRPVSVQLMGGDPQVMAQAARLAEAAGADIVDINMGCPVPKVVKTSGGSSLLRDPDRAVRVAEAVVEAVSVPVTVKIRLGWDFTTRNYLEMATRLEATGIEGLAVHGRTRSQRYDPSADWIAIPQVKAAGKIPVAGRGDLRASDPGPFSLDAEFGDGPASCEGAWRNFSASGASYWHGTCWAASARPHHGRLWRAGRGPERIRYRVRHERAVLCRGGASPTGGGRDRSPDTDRDWPDRLRDGLRPDPPYLGRGQPAPPGLGAAGAGDHVHGHRPQGADRRRDRELHPGLADV